MEKIKAKFYILDAESDGLLDTVTKVHVIGWHCLDNGKSGYITDYDTMKRFLQQDDLVLICHNLIRFDIPLFKMILKVNPKAIYIDTLALSWYLFPERLKHGLEEWGEEFGIMKPKVTDWSEQHINVYLNRVVEDVKINHKLWLEQWHYLLRIYNGDEAEAMRLIRYLGFKMDCAREQEEVKWKLDIETCKENLNLFSEEFERKAEILAEKMPEVIKYKYLNRPKIYHKKDGELSKLAQNWEDILEDLGLPTDYTDTLSIEKAREIGNPNSQPQVKAWLYSMGWVPNTFKYDTNKVTGKVRKIPQISLPHGKGICPSVKLLYKEEPILEELDMLYVIRHRLGLLKGFLRDVDSEGYLQAQVAGFTNTLRFKHKTIVNLPKPTGKGDWKDGSFIRGCLVAPDGMVLCGSDMSSLEDRTKQHYMFYFDKPYVELLNSEGYDPHLDMSTTAGLITEDEEEFYKWYSAKEH